MDWKLIETAPKDGTLIIGYAPKDGLERRRTHMQIVHWSIKDPWVSGWEVYGGGFSCLDFSHWAALPFPPVLPG